MKKSAPLLPLIIQAKTQEEAKLVLHKVLDELYLSNQYLDIVKHKDTLEEFKNQFEEIVNEYKSYGNVRSYADLHSIRVDLNFLYREITDALSFEINRLKIYFEEYKTVQRAESMQRLKEDKDFQGKIKAISTSALRDIVGADQEYNEYVTATSISYGLYQDLQSTLNGIRQFTDSVASEESYLRIIENKDVK